MTVSLGVPGLDEVLRGGIPERSGTLALGGPGTGKTTLGLQFAVEGARRGGRSLYITTESFREQLYAAASAFGWDLLELQAAGTLQVLFTPPEAVLSLPDLFAEAAPDRIVLDTLSQLQRVVPAEEWRTQTLRLMVAAKRVGAAALFLCEADPPGLAREAEYAADNVLALRLRHGRAGAVRDLLIRKVRGLSHPLDPIPFVIGPGGIEAGLVEPAPDAGRAGTGELTSTGLDELDTQLGGGLAPGTLLLVERSWRTSAHFLLLPAVKAALERGWSLAWWLSPTVASRDLLALFERYGLDVRQLQDRTLFVDPLGMLSVDQLAGRMLPVPGAGGDDFEKTQALLHRRLDASGQRWIQTLELQPLVADCDPKTALRLVTRLAARTRARGDLAVLTLGPAGVPREVVLAARDQADAVLRVSGWGQHLLAGFAKNRFGPAGERMLVRFTSEPPFVRLVSRSPASREPETDDVMAWVARTAAKARSAT